MNGEIVKFQSWKFPAGEVGIKLPELNPYGSFDILATMPSSDEIFVMFNMLDALYQQNIPRDQINLHIPYMPYGRQDRVCHEGESFALRVFGHMLKAFPHYNKIHVKDMHSSMTQVVLESHGVQFDHRPQASCARYLPKFDGLIAPDKGAAEKVKTHYQVSALGVSCYTILKERKDGQVTYIDYPFDTIKGKVCVVDDICDGGATFLALAEMLYRTQPNMSKLCLYVTHGIFSKGVEELLKKYATIYVHNNMNPYVADSVIII
jgi:ribose-phosphate pyrophosphokinase